MSTASMSTTAPAASVPATRAELIESKLDKKAASALAVSQEAGGMVFKDMGELLEFSKLMSLSLQAVPPHCRNQPGVCLGICIQAIEWRMSPFAVANKTYLVNDRIGYESQLVHAVIEQRAPIQQRLKHEYIGEGGKRRCKVWATPKGEDEPKVYISPEFDRIQPKNSPLWKTKPDLQLFYNASRDWARMHFPDVIMGVYTEDEMRDAMPGSQAVERPRGIAGLKQQLVGGPEDNPADEHQPTREEYEGAVRQEQSGEPDQTQPEDDGRNDHGGVDNGMGNPQSMTREEEAELEQQASGRNKQTSAFPTHSEVGQ